LTSLFKSAAYRIAVTYAAAFALATILLGMAVYLAADAAFRGQRDHAIAEELAELAQEGGRRGIMQEIREREANRATAGFGYALFDPAGRQVAGTLATTRPVLGYSDVTFLDPIEGPDTARAKAVDLRDGSRLLVGIDTETLENIDRTILVIFAVAFLAVLLFGAAGAMLLGRYLRLRLATISTTAGSIVAGDTSLRMPVSPRGDEFDIAAMALNAMLDRITALMDNLRQVSSDVAHDLRTPLVRLRNQLEQVGHVDGAAERALELGDELLRLFSAILRIAEVEGGGLDRDFEPVDLSGLVADIADGFAPALADTDHRLEWRVASNVAISGNRDLLAQALANLLDNFRVHTPAGTQAELVLDAGEREARISLADDGRGVPEEEREAILRRFYRTEASRTTPGNGLGLSLVAAVAGIHGGTVHISDNGPGLKVIITLPRAFA
jgi:signal transduction histidine kinase